MEKEIQNILKLAEPVRCPKCGTAYQNAILGIYVCDKCGHEEANSFGKVRSFLEQNGKAPAVVISDATNVPVKKINEFLRQGRLEIPEGSHVYIKCEKCNSDIRFGRYCSECALLICKQLNVALCANEIGEKPKAAGKMQFFQKHHIR
ncbi:MAG: hypothetical protein E7256_02245 [Lachnospiraceae bacterium]|nr:hypothetical protein [Lachnospiraceae bacterium]